ncbi:MAG: hypothetical protein AB1779_03950 [Candidatus Thermoplasmatota archaeon]
MAEKKEKDWWIIIKYDCPLTLLPGAYDLKIVLKSPGIRAASVG